MGSVGLVPALQNQSFVLSREGQGRFPDKVFISVPFPSDPF